MANVEQTLEKIKKMYAEGADPSSLENLFSELKDEFSKKDLVSALNDFMKNDELSLDFNEQKEKIKKNFPHVQGDEFKEAIIKSESNDDLDVHKKFALFAAFFDREKDYYRSLLMYHLSECNFYKQNNDALGVMNKMLYINNVVEKCKECGITDAEIKKTYNIILLKEDAIDKVKKDYSMSDDEITDIKSDSSVKSVPEMPLPTVTNIPNVTGQSTSSVSEIPRLDDDDDLSDKFRILEKPSKKASSVSEMPLPPVSNIPETPESEDAFDSVLNDFLDEHPEVAARANGVDSESKDPDEVVRKERESDDKKTEFVNPFVRTTDSLVWEGSVWGKNDDLELISTGRKKLEPKKIEKKVKRKATKDEHVSLRKRIIDKCIKLLGLEDDYKMSGGKSR